VNLGPTELIIILLIALLLFGSTKLPKLARSLGEAQKEFKAGTDEVTGKAAAAPRTEAEIREDELRVREAELRRREDALRQTEDESPS
jgi:sec-independent protein translocase protein TatA